MNFSEEVKATLWNLIDDMSLDLSDFTVNPGKDFTRKKKWDFPTLMKFIISMESQSLKNELHKYFGYTTDCPSTASFNQRRSQIRADAFEFLFTNFTAQYSNNLSLFKGYRLIACDGSDVNIAHNPDDKDSYFKNGANARGFNQLHLNAMYDLLDKIYTDIIIQPGTITKCTNKHVYQINYTFAIHICRYFISKMAGKSPPDVEALISKEILPVRPGRHDPRKVDHKKAVSFLYRVA